MVLKCADIGHLAATPRAHKHWAYQLEEEFFCQGDKERACGLPVSPLMDRSTQGGMTRSQVTLLFPSSLSRPPLKAAHLLRVCCTQRFSEEVTWLLLVCLLVLHFVTYCLGQTSSLPCTNANTPNMSPIYYIQRMMQIAYEVQQTVMRCADMLLVLLQMGFFSIVGIPMFKAMAELFEESQPMLEGVLANYHHWEAATPDAELPS